MWAETIMPGVEIPLPPEPYDDGPPLPTPLRRNGSQHGLDARLDGDDLDGAVAWRKQRLRVEREARRQLDAEERPSPAIPAVRPLAALLAEPDAPTSYCIDKLMPVESRVMLSAQFKAGKSTLVANLIRALVDGTPFLGKFEVRRPVRRLVLIDDELGDTLLRRWLRDQSIENEAAVADVVSLRGRVAALNLLDPEVRRQWVERLRGLECDYLILDCLRPVLDALGLDENHDAGKFLVPFDAMLHEAGVGGALLVQHMGHTSERSRGDSRLQDWPDAIWRLVREDDDPASPRYFSAYGRDVEVREGRLTFDQSNRRLTFTDGDRVNAKTEAAYGALIKLLAEDARQGEKGDDGKPLGLGTNAIEDAIGGPKCSRKAVRDAIVAALDTGVVEWQRGPRKAKLHRIANPCQGCGLPVTGADSRHQSCGAESDGLTLL
jgi:hypothetical protein